MHIHTWFKLSTLTQRAAAIRLGVSFSYFNKVIHEEIIPSPEIQRRIRIVTKGVVGPQDYILVNPACDFALLLEMVKKPKDQWQEYAERLGVQLEWLINFVELEIINKEQKKCNRKRNKKQ